MMENMLNVYYIGCMSLHYLIGSVPYVEGMVGTFVSNY